LSYGCKNHCRTVIVHTNILVAKDSTKAKMNMLRILGTKKVLGSYRGGFHVYTVRSNHYVIEKLKSLNELGKKIADEKSDESKKVIKNFRKIGVGSIFVVILSIIWASMQDQGGNIENMNFDDLKLDDFKKN
jgi:hypothetical protein